MAFLETLVEVPRHQLDDGGKALRDKIDKSFHEFQSIDRENWISNFIGA